MTKVEFDTTKWYKGIKVRELGKPDSYAVNGVNFEENTISFLDEGKSRVLPYKSMEIVK